MTYTKLAIATVALVVVSSAAFAKPEREKCNPNGTANETIGCVQNMYVDLWEKLVKHYENKLDAVVAACAKEKPGGGSGGHQDRVECVTKRYEEEAKRVKLPKQ